MLSHCISTPPHTHSQAANSWTEAALRACTYQCTAMCGSQALSQEDTRYTAIKPTSHSPLHHLQCTYSQLQSENTLHGTTLIVTFLERLSLLKIQARATQTGRPLPADSSLSRVPDGVTRPCVFSVHSAQLRFTASSIYQYISYRRLFGCI